MHVEISPELHSLIAEKMATGAYASQDQLLIVALQSLDEYDQTVADVQAGLADEAAGRLHSAATVRDELLSKLRSRQ
ncbi:MAG: hypothetical protein CMJ58_21650 [Planctomycetaceae bacterium]|nr:hypothetical protein [Planctomycetaceae bacterium]